MKAIYLILALLFASNLAFANDDLFNGQIKNDNGQTLERAWVLVLDADDMTYVTGTITDENGYFAIPALGEGNFIISVDHPEFDEPKIIKEVNSLEVENFLPGGILNR